MTELLTLSASKLKTFSVCPRRYYQQYIARSDRTQHPAATMGTGIHKAVERYYKEGVDPLVSYITVWNEAFTQYPELLTDGRTHKAQKEGTEILGRYDFKARVPKETELEFRLPFPDPIEPVCIIHGFIDHIYDNAMLVDLKSGRNRPSSGVLNFDSQFVLYDWAYFQLYGEPARSVIWHHLRTGEDIRANTGIAGAFENTQRLIDRLLRLHRRLDRVAVASGGDVDAIAAYAPSQFDRCVGDACLFCPFRVPCLGATE